MTTPIAFAADHRVGKEELFPHPEFHEIEYLDRHPRISRTPTIWGGKAIIGGTRIPVFLVAQLYADSPDVDEILRLYPHLSVADVFAALAYAHEFRPTIEAERRDHLEAFKLVPRLPT